MGDVSDAGTSESVDLQAIMNGGANWMDRMTAFQVAKEAAEKAIAEAGIVGNIAALQSEAEAKRRKAQEVLDEAKMAAEDLRNQAQKSANDIISSAKAAADKLVDAATSRAAALDGQANGIYANAQSKLAEANAMMSQMLTRSAQVDDREASAQMMAKEAAAAKEAAEAEKARLTELINTVLSLAKQIGDVSVG